MHLALGRGRHVLIAALNRHRDAEVRTGKLAIDDLDGTAVRRDELEHYGQPDAGALYGAAARRAAGIKSLENVGAVLGRDARSIVSDVQLQQRAFAPRAQVHGASLG